MTPEERLKAICDAKAVIRKQKAKIEFLKEIGAAQKTINKHIWLIADAQMIIKQLTNSK